MTSAYLTDLRQRLCANRDRLDDELKHVPPDYTKAAFYERQIERLLEEIKMCSTTEVLGKVVFGVTVEQGEFPDFVFELPTSNNEVLLEDVEKRLAWHNPPLRLKTVNNVPATARPSNKTLVANFKDGDRLELVADIAPDPPEGRVKHQNKMYNMAWWGAMLGVAGLVLTALYTILSWIYKLKTGKGK
ncbi:TPA: hypothetical protein ACH3X1_009333 [Trebouxia sp. C0004]